MVILNSCVRIRDTGLQILGKAAAFAGLYLKSRCTGELSAYVLSRDMADPALQICYSNVAMILSRRYGVLVSEYKTRLTYLRQSHRNWWNLIKVPVHQRVLGTYTYDYHCIIVNYIPQSTQSARLLNSYVGIWEKDSRISGKATDCAGISEPLRYTSDLDPRESETEMRLGYSWLSCRFRCWVCAVLELKFWHNWDMRSSP